MSSIASNAEDLILNADGGSSTVKIKINGTEKASISSAGAFTSTTIDATALTGTIPNFTSTGIDDNADATAITIDSSERVGIGTTSMEANLHIKKGDSGASVHPLTALYIENNADTILQIGSPNNAEGRIFFTDPEDSNIGQISYGHSDNHMRFRTNDSEQFRITSDGRGISDFTVRAWCHFSGIGTPSFWGSAQHNVSSISDIATGNYNVNFTNAMANVNYCAIGTGQGGLNVSPDGWATTYVKLNIRVEATNSSVDGGHVGVAVFTEA